MFKKTSLLFALTATTWLAACAPHQGASVQNQLVVEPDSISLRLINAVDQAAASLKTLAQVEQARHPNFSVATVPDAPIELRRTLSIDWNGPIEPLARRLADRAGYNFMSIGDKPPVPIVISITAVQKPIVELLRDVGLQAGTRADIIVDVDRHVVEVSYAPITGS